MTYLAQLTPTVRRAIGLKAPKARNVIAWGSAPGGVPANRRALKARNEPSGLVLRELRQELHYAPSALSVSVLRVPGALPQAVTFRAFGALKQSFAEGHLFGEETRP